MRKVLLFIGCCCAFCSSRAQIACDSVTSVFRHWEERIASLNYEDPELINLHYLFLQDIQKEIHRFQERDLPKLHYCLQLDYYGTKADFQKVQYKANRAEAVLSERKALVDRMFYERAKEDLAFLDTINALYNLDRALQFNKYQPEALLMKARLKLAQKSYQESVDLIHLLYTQAELNDEMEMAVSDFTLELYEELYQVGDNLVKNNRSAEALEVFLALEQFCTNMPSGYCNDDYYRGILRSREGVYESYIAIAREAELRHNHEMARKFYQYAEEWKQRGKQ
ncbi:MAG: hypothetical protein IKZ52_03195 [Bacteroidales bacterium]|nr:hypothetical protein [Bacteroidales bacterium]